MANKTFYEEIFPHLLNISLRLFTSLVKSSPPQKIAPQNMQ